jgi:hypothetical protein
MYCLNRTALRLFGSFTPDNDVSTRKLMSGNVVAVAQLKEAVDIGLTNRTHLHGGRKGVVNQRRGQAASRFPWP